MAVDSTIIKAHDRAHCVSLVSALRSLEGEIQLLVLASGSLTKIADSQAEFQSLVAVKENQRGWFSLDLYGTRASRDVIGAGSMLLV